MVGGDPRKPQIEDVKNWKTIAKKTFPKLNPTRVSSFVKFDDTIVIACHDENVVVIINKKDVDILKTLVWSKKDFLDNLKSKYKL